MFSLLSRVLFLIFAFAHPVERREPQVYFFPPELNASKISEGQAEQLLTVFKCEFASDFGDSPWMIDFAWQQPHVGAGASKPEEIFRVMVWGGFVRAEFMTLGALSAVVCHEIGHHLAGPPKQALVPWASAEGASDHFAATVCLPRIYRALKAQAPELLIPSEESITRAMCGWHKDPAQCEWVMTSGIDLIQFLQVYYERDVPMASPLAKASDQPLRTLADTYPSYQCRMDIFVQGALCPRGLLCPRQACWFVSEE